MTAAATIHTTLSELAEWHPRLSKRQIADVLKAAEIQGTPGKGVTLWPAIRTLLEYELSQGQDSNAASRDAGARYKKNRADIKRLEYAQKSKAVIGVDVLLQANSRIQGKLIECLASIPGCGPLIAEMNDPLYVRDFLKERVRIVLVRIDEFIQGIEEGLRRKRAKGDEIAASSDDAASPTDRILDAIRDSEDMEQLEAFIEQEVLGV